jgi:glutamate synthase (NADPH/NADH) large chain
VVNYFFFVAEELRAIMARLGFRTLEEMVGQVGCLRSTAGEGAVVESAPGEKGWGAAKARSLDFRAVLAAPASTDSNELHCTRKQPDLLAKAIDKSVIARVAATLQRRGPSEARVAITNADRAFGALLAGEIATQFGAAGLPEDSIRLEATGTAGQSFGAFAVRGMSIALEGDANDYVGKGLSGGVLAIRPPAGSRFQADANVIVGNTVLYGATSGRAFFAGRAGERFAVRNSGASTVVEGVGDHGCEYMTGGVVAILGTTGRNFAAGMSGGIAYVLDEDGGFAKRCNAGMVELTRLDDEDEVALRALVDEHVARTQSAKGRALLSSWREACARFVKVLPLEYKRVLASRRPAHETTKAAG